MAEFHLSIVSPEETLLEEMVESIIVPGAKGYLGVLAHHAPLITPLLPGKITIRRAGHSQTEIMAVSGGFLEVANNQATVLADAAEPAEKIDRERAKSALDRARQRLKEGGPDIDTARAMAAAERARNRLKVLSDWQ